MRYTRYLKNSYFLQLLFDIVFIIILFFYFLKIQYYHLGIYVVSLKELLDAHYKVLILLLMSWYFISLKTHLYEIKRNTGIGIILKNNIFQIILFGVITFFVSGLKKDDLFSNKVTIYFLISLFLITFFIRVVLFLFLKIYRSLGGNYIRVIFVDENNNTLSFIKFLSKRKDYGYVNCGSFLANIKDDIKKNKYKFDLEKLKSFILEEEILIIFFSLNGKLSHSVHDELVVLAQKLHMEIRFIPSTLYNSFYSLDLEYYDTYPILLFKKFPLDDFWNQFIKRLFDILFSLFVIIFILSWLYPLIAIAILLESGKPVIYAQKRVGLGGNIFYCYKFRTMKNSEDNDIKATVKDDSRVTQLGRILRKSSLDEMPQFFNVLKGNMSVVGPRPHMVVQDNYYNDLLLRYSRRHHVKPGITGLAQVKGFRGEINSREDMQKRIIADIYYVRKWTFYLDMIIILRTVFKTIGGDKKAI
ncbi:MULTISPECIES: exopolysaccharide biosynthesis polyprenyl glycosylphosphotransferase [unclassified Apibacter]|uniref:exopolysaccharide biosynthesis polyprenyl glycosylphosphotransferase n=1 Tax=unclassified Apibacter TaxID=2630820 RepID=UPI00132180FE|nr:MULTISPECIES: exopolysaccharide biosynthesis polyprenyl glycosylphosphotransferase [unclassified Apibacter]MCX8676851.1 exopolysaccharide biosynthesis polyprenyl glycosylphosphotransferase [Apibacter sp. B3919]MXO24767.1 exopolysaccharide biosynthesis polyprenyl glycosylphosphotransferase [Apibacter sp. B3924]MXO26011.1 exopolysaccharide biosynthesis polyprenyl glycosylphosphotransferase [Apibacter sp. B3813]MXO27962.1 exopolysaccharide biosynthesis polyprenyl glycosylphosphotransferase [Api